jgi:hypothetical protein
LQKEKTLEVIVEKEKEVAGREKTRKVNMQLVADFDRVRP